MELSADANVALLWAMYLPDHMRQNEAGDLHYRHENGIGVTVHPARNGQALLVPKKPRETPPPPPEPRVFELLEKRTLLEVARLHGRRMLWELLSGWFIWFSVGFFAGIIALTSVYECLGRWGPDVTQSAPSDPTHEEMKGDEP
jgi:hypothetical protein